jgi:hypothetical protein
MEISKESVCRGSKLDVNGSIRAVLQQPKFGFYYFISSVQTFHIVELAAPWTFSVF